MPENKPAVVVITGASGEVGAAIAQALQGQYSVVGLDKKSDPSAKFQFMKPTLPMTNPRRTPSTG